MKTNKYKCSQQELYITCTLGWQSCNQHLTEFSAFKAKYNAAFIATQLGAIAATQSLPDEQRRGEPSESLRIRLKTQNQNCLDLWQKLKRYIVDTWPEAEQKPKLDAAGYRYYRDAGAFTWSACQAMMLSADGFVKANAAALSGQDNMPAAFAAELEGALNSFMSLYQEFLNSGEEAVVQTEAKIEANNALYESLMGMFLDGQELFKNQEALVKQFVFDQVLLLVSATGPAGLKGTVRRNVINPVPVSGALVRILQTDQSTTTDAEGRYEFAQLAAGTYDLEISAADYVLYAASGQVIHPGATATLDINLVPLAPV